MSITLVEASKLSNDSLRAGVIDTIAETSPALQRLPFIPVLGNGLSYNRVNARPTAAFYDVGATWAESTPTFTQATATLKILGGDADVDNFLKKTRSNVQDLAAEITTVKARAIAALFLDTYMNGDSGSDPNSFDGLDLLCAAGQTVSMGTNGATLTLEKLDELIDKIRGGPITHLEMSRRTRRTLNVLVRTSGSFLESTRDEFGMFQWWYAGIPIVINDYISDAQTAGTSSDCSTVYAVRYDPVGGVAGIASEGAPGDPSTIVQVEDIGALETKDADRYRVKMYASLVCFDSYALAKLTGVRG